MNSTMDKSKGHFYLDKWFLDLVTNDGDAFIFYTAKMRWHKITIPFKSLISQTIRNGTEHKKRFYNADLPVNEKDQISWSDKAFKIKGEWNAVAKPIYEKIYDSPEGYLQWNCFQPASSVKVRMNGKEITGWGYAEQLILTIEPWKMLMDELRWGRFVSGQNSCVWIQIKGQEQNQWVWLNGKKINRAVISDDGVTIKDESIHLDIRENRDTGTVSNITEVIKKLTRFIPGFNRLMPLNFLMAKENKWIGKGSLYKEGLLECEGWVIHERVDFKN